MGNDELNNNAADEIIDPNVEDQNADTSDAGGTSAADDAVDEKLIPESEVARRLEQSREDVSKDTAAKVIEEFEREFAAPAPTTPVAATPVATGPAADPEAEEIEILRQKGFAAVQAGIDPELVNVNFATGVEAIRTRYELKRWMESQSSATANQQLSQARQQLEAKIGQHLEKQGFANGSPEQTAVAAILEKKIASFQPQTPDAVMELTDIAVADYRRRASRFTDKKPATDAQPMAAGGGNPPVPKGDDMYIPGEGDIRKVAQRMREKFGLT